MKDLLASCRGYYQQTYDNMLKTKEDMLRYEYLMKLYQPSCVVEIGTYTGGSAAWFATYCPVFTVDIQDQWQEQNSTRNVVRHIGASLDPRTITAVKRFVRNYPRPLVILDGDHSTLTVLRELYTYSKMLPWDGWVVVEDGLVRWMDGTNEMPDLRYLYGDGPLGAIEIFLDIYPEWVPDMVIEDMFDQTQFPQGWLHKIGEPRAHTPQAA